jgi:hypothetical protein
VTNPTTFSYDFSVNPAPGRKDSVPEFFAVDALSEWPLGSNQVSVRNPRNGRELTVPGDHSSTLVAHCSVFRTLDEHVAELMAGSDGAPARAAAIRKVVESFRDGGLTISAAEICGELAPTPGAAPIVEKPVVVIITCDRPQVLPRLLNSILASCDLGAVDSLFVVDDSRSAENGTANRELTLAADREASIDCHYFGGAEVRELTENLISELPQHEEALRFLLDRDRWKDQKSYGLARNFSHLLSVGKPVVVFDDDALCEAYDPPFPAAGVAFNTGQQEVAFYANHEEWRQGLARSSLDPVAGHMRCLGLALPDALSVLGLEQLAQESLRPAPVAFARSLSRDSRVLVTECGSLGDPGTGTNRWLAKISAASRERLLAREDGLRQALENRCCWLGRERPEFHPRSKISQVTGFDNRMFLPPYFPIDRGEDGLFGKFVEFIYPSDVTLVYPWAVPHLPIPERKWTEQENRYSIGARFPATLHEDLLRNSKDCLAANVADRLAFLGRLFEDLAAAPDTVLLERLAHNRHAYRASQIRMLKERMAEASALPADWRNYVEDAMWQVESSSFGELSIEKLKGSIGNLEGPELIQFWRDAWRSFGCSLTAWADIREAAQKIVAEEYG